MALVGAAVYRQELAERLAWAAPRARERLRRQCAAQPWAYWLHFALPGTCALVAYGLPNLRLAAWRTQRGVTAGWLPLLD